MAHVNWHPDLNAGQTGLMLVREVWRRARSSSACGFSRSFSPWRVWTAASGAPERKANLQARGMNPQSTVAPFRQRSHSIEKRDKPITLFEVQHRLDSSDSCNPNERQQGKAFGKGREEERFYMIKKIALLVLIVVSLATFAWAEFYKVHDLRKIDSNLYHSRIDHVIIKTQLCLHLAVGEDAVVKWDGSNGKIFWDDDDESCEVVGIYKD
jgi:hypothetical protein